MPDLAALQDAHMLMQDADSILYPPDDNEVESTPATATKRRISVSDLWSQTATPSLPSDEGSEVAHAFPDPSSQMSIAPRLRPDCLLEAEPHPEPAPAEKVSLDLRSVFPADPSQVLHWHPNRCLLALVQVAQSRAEKRFPLRRVRKKRFSAVLVLKSMSSKTYKPARNSARWRTAGRDTYRRVMAVVAGASIRATAKATDTAWTQLSLAHKNAWADMARILASRMGADLSVNLSLSNSDGPTRTLTDRKEAAEKATKNVQFTGYGLSMCFNTDFGQKNVETVKLVQSGLRGPELRMALVKLPEYEEFFDRFYAHFEKVGRELGVPLVACGMEHSENGDHLARIHLHCFAGIDVRGGIYGRAPEEVTVPKSCLMFEGLRPSVGVTTSSRKRNAVIHTAVVQSYYYVAGPKFECLFSRGVAVLFKVHSQRLVSGMEWSN